MPVSEAMEASRFLLNKLMTKYPKLNGSSFFEQYSKISEWLDHNQVQMVAGNLEIM